MLSRECALPGGGVYVREAVFISLSAEGAPQNEWIKWLEIDC